MTWVDEMSLYICILYRPLIYRTLDFVMWVFDIVVDLFRVLV